MGLREALITESLPLLSDCENYQSFETVWRKDHSSAYNSALSTPW